ncbi:LysR substrate-binding domain-containing protein [Cupriavidus malaysiensis]|uniref:LysR family transcriptional regulator n=1 Tax=Cupriavidus malaysiensis TaxID=367825 RepID=A0ABN4TMI8_9BURK|nr:LysR substrate-binding domain-containing protein [Cupriavidus malaysiensis]AOZ08537.1 LysR family transcriptional regulator [Cupriavidus malaysiensis]
MTANSAIQPAELGFFAALAGAGSLSAAARDLGITTAAVSKRLAQMEARIGMPLVVRTTRRMSLTPEGEVVLEHARRILGEIDDLGQLLTSAKGRPSGLLRVNATLGFGRMHVAPVIAAYSRAYPDVDVQLQLSADPPPLSEDAFDVCVRFGEPPDARIVARLLAPNRRLLCAAPKYLRDHGAPQSPADLPRHNCIGIRQGSDAYGVWRLTPVKGAKARTESVHVRGNLTTNDGEIAVNWALEGHGIVLRAEWDVERYLRSGRLVQVLPQYATPEANIYAVYQQRHQLSSRIRLFVDFLAAKFAAFGR